MRTEGAKTTGYHSLLKGKALKLGDNISTDLIIPGRTFGLGLRDLAKHVFEDADPALAAQIRLGDFIAAGSNFGLGSSRERAPMAIKEAGVGAVLAKSVARIFFRNTINVGLPIIICDTTNIEQGDELEVNLESGTVKDLTNGFYLSFKGLPEVMLRILQEGGLVAYVRKYGDFPRV